MSKQFKVAVVGATGAVGEVIVVTIDDEPLVEEQAA